MSNINYYRFQNTSSDLSDCREALQEIVEGGDDCHLGEAELRAVKRLVSICAEIILLLSEFMDIPVEDLVTRHQGAADALDSLNEKCNVHSADE